MFGATNAGEQQTGRNFADTVSILQSSDWRSNADRYKLTEGTTRQVSSRI